MHDFLSRVAVKNESHHHGVNAAVTDTSNAVSAAPATDTDEVVEVVLVGRETQLRPSRDYFYVSISSVVRIDDQQKAERRKRSGPCLCSLQTFFCITTQFSFPLNFLCSFLQSSKEM